MPTDLETAIRDALRARADATVPREDALRPRRSGGRHLPLLAAAAIVLLAVTVALVVARRDTHPAPAGGSAAFVGYRWDVVAVDSGSTHAGVPPGWNAYIAFGRHGDVMANDALNTLSGTYRVTADGYTVRDMVSTAIGYDGRDPARVAVIFAVDAVLGGSGPHPAPVSAQVHGTRLTLTVPGQTVFLTRAGAAPQPVPASPTPTSS